ncbi:hypothetical protein PISMIDRAFT_684673 [Pisolithus microcarpus 441]|uniref:DUF6533 domain-containing protein n=1 Tax=Pisolithus microcarpus 441 TaxID=765257 RepID=A0A0C9XZH0_9AGAM|nr:hypothetical protein PISMIDRAFT_684673 [Pisolithus microcarpus 441]
MYHTQGISPAASLAVVSCVLFIYDFALTFAKEVDLFWLQPRRTWVFVFFIANRYIGLLGRIPEFLGIFFGTSGSPVCSGLLFSDRVIAVVLQLVGGVIMIARVHAFYNKDRRVPSLLIAVAVISVGLSCWALLFLPPPEPTATAQSIHAGCRESMTSAECLTNAFGSDWAAAWGGQLLFDALVFLFTLRKLISVRRSLGKRSFMAVSLRDGMFYFNVGNAALCAVIISRLILNLRDLEHELSRTNDIGSIAMQRFINSGF